MNDPESPDALPPNTSKPILEYHTGASSLPEIDARRWVDVWTAQNAFEANLAVNKLDQQGIPARVDNENLETLGHWGLSGPGGTKVQVPAGHAQEAREILETVERQKSERLNRNAPQCPQCEHRPAKRSARLVRWAGILMLCSIPFAMISIQVADTPVAVNTPVLFGLLAGGVYFLIVRTLPRWRCPACGHRWAEAEPKPPPEDDDDERDNDDAE